MMFKRKECKLFSCPSLHWLVEQCQCITSMKKASKTVVLEVFTVLPEVIYTIWL